MEAAAAAMDFNTLSRRELQALCKRNGIRANMTNIAMAEALQGLTSVDGIDEIGTTLCLPTPGRSAMKSAAKVVAVEEQQHGSPLPRGRRVSVKSPEAIRMEVEGGEGETKEIVKTPGVALRSTRRGARATPAPLPTPAPAGSTRATARRTAARKAVEVVPTPATRRSQRTAARKAVGADQSAEEIPVEKISNMTIALDQEAEVVAAASKEEKVQEDEPKAALSDEKCDDPNEEKVQEEESIDAVLDVKFDDSKEKGQQEEPNAVASDVNDEPEEEVAQFSEGENKQEELEEGEEADSSDATTVSAAILIKSCNNPKVEEVVAVLEEQSTTPHEGSAAVLIESCNDPKVEEVVVVLEEQSTTPHQGNVEEEEPTGVDSPILGVIDTEQDASVENCEDLAEFSPAREMTDENNPAEDKEVSIREEPVTEDKEVAISEEALTEDKVVAINEEAVQEDSFANTVETDPTPKEILLTAAGEDETIEEDDEMPQAGEISEEDEDDLSEEDEDDLSEGEIEGADAKMLQGELMDYGTSEEDLDEDEEWASDDDESSEEIGDDENSEEIGSDESDEDTDETTGAVQMLQGTGMAEEANEDAFSEDDDFSGDLPPECDNMMIFSDAETESDIASPVLEENHPTVASATKSAKTHDDSATEQEEGPEEADATEEVDNIVKSLDEFTFKEGESEEMQKQPQDYHNMSLRKLKSTLKNKLIAAKQEGKQEEVVTEGKRLPLEEVDENACINH